jgi:hypothetical protein
MVDHRLDRWLAATGGFAEGAAPIQFHYAPAPPGSRCFPKKVRDTLTR